MLSDPLPLNDDAVPPAGVRTMGNAGHHADFNAAAVKVTDDRVGELKFVEQTDRGQGRMPSESEVPILCIRNP